MNDPRWTTIEGLFDAALERDPQERASFLREACAGNEMLRREVESLLAHARAEDFLDRPADEVMGRLPTGDNQSPVGHSLGPYRIVDLLGRGGMGEVYRAHDTTLGRDVAIKILPSVFTTDADRRARFDREARVLAALNHPHIGAIYGVQETDGVRALVLELVEGDTLADRIATGALPVQEALSIARQIADALEAAHEKGIVHRDLKPANIKITPAGVVKVLDFGLAKATADASAPDLTQPPTVTSGSTRDGVILGTAAYMSPEQARGKPVDRRTDIWAFGCVLYEMLTGRVAFAGNTVSDTIAAILEREPNWQTLSSATPGKIQDLLRRCLEKDSRRRLRDIGDARLEIEDVFSSASLTSTGTAGALRQQRHLGPPWSIVVVTSLLALVGVGLLTLYMWKAPQAPIAPPRISRMTMASSGAAAVASGVRSLAITPDGTRVVYEGNNGRQIFVRPLDQLDSNAIFTGAAPLNWIMVSHDGQSVGFQEGATLKKVALAGGPAVTIADTGNASPYGATWAPDDTIIFANADRATGLQRVSAAGGEVSVLTRPDPARGELDHLWPEILPGGGAVLFTITSATGGPAAAQVAVLDLVTRMPKVLLPGGSDARYLPSGHLVYTAGATLRAVPFDLARLETRGTPVTVLPGLASRQGVSNFVVAGDGTLAYVDGEVDTLTATRTLVWVDRQGREEPLVGPQRAYVHPRVSPDGNRVAVHISEQEGEIWVWDLRRERPSQLTFGPGPNFSPVWTADGHRLFFFSAARAEGLFWQAADGTGAPEALGRGLPSGVTPDGKQVIFSPGGRDVVVLTLGTGRVEPLVQTPFNERNGVISPRDGRWLAYESDSSGRFEIYVQPFPNVSAGQWRISTAGGTRPLWSPSGQELFYVAPDGALMSVDVGTRGGTWSAGSPAKILEGPYMTQTSISSRNYDVSADGKRFLMVRQPVNQAAAPQIVVVLDWFEELKRLVPTPQVK